MNTDYGFAKINIGDSSYELAPTLINISKIGSPKDIVNCFVTLSQSALHTVYSFRTASKILIACGIPEHVVGHVIFSVNRKKSLIKVGKLPISDVFVLANHCLVHGVCGIIDKDDKQDGEESEALTEFNAHDYIIIAIDVLGMTLREAEGLTMTQLIKLIKSKKRAHDLSNGTETKAVDKKKEQMEEDEALENYYKYIDKINENTNII